MRAVSHYCTDRWVLLYVRRWLVAAIIQQDGSYVDRVSGTPQGGVVSPLLANIFLHVVFNKWMELHHPRKPFESYADDIVVHWSQSLVETMRFQRKTFSCYTNG